MTIAVTWDAGKASPRAQLTAALSDGNTLADYQAGVGQTNAGGGLCSAWTNQIGALPSLTASGTGRPTINANGSLTFDGVANFMVASSLGAHAQPLEIYVVLSQDSWTAGNYFFDGIVINRITVIPVTATPKVHAFAGSFLADNANLAVGTKSVITVVANGASSSFKVDGTAATTGDAGTNGLDDGFTLAAQGNGASAFANITVSEVIIRTAVSATTQATIQSLLKSIYGTP